MKKNLILIFMIFSIFMFFYISYASENSYYTDVEYVTQGVEEYTITVPAKMVPGSSSNIIVEGTWASNRSVVVSADQSVELTNNLNPLSKKILQISFNGIDGDGNDLGSSYFEETISLDEMPSDVLFGTWSGRFSYSTLIKDATVDFSINGIEYSVAKGVTWSQFLNGDTYEKPMDVSIDEYFDEVYTGGLEYIYHESNQEICAHGNDIIIDGEYGTLYYLDEYVNIISFNVINNQNNQSYSVKKESTWNSLLDEYVSLWYYDDYNEAFCYIDCSTEIVRLKYNGSYVKRNDLVIDGATYIVEDPSIHFSIIRDGYNYGYSAVEGMTWGEWWDMAGTFPMYNVVNGAVYADYRDDVLLKLNGELVMETDSIIDGAVYTYGNTRLNEEVNNPYEFKFYINGSQYTAMSNMTWADWIGSDYAPINPEQGLSKKYEIRSSWDYNRISFYGMVCTYYVARVYDNDITEFAKPSDYIMPNAHYSDVLKDNSC